jgi:hypothetical protein
MAVEINIPKPIIDYNDLDNKPNLVTEHSELNLDDGTNPHGTTASDVGAYTTTETDNLLNNKVDKVTGKGLSENDFTNTLKTKLDGIQAGAEVNVNADWNATSGDAQILNKPTIPDTSDFVEKSDFTSHSILAKQSGASDPVAVSIGNNEILGRKSGGGSNIEGLSVSEVKSLLNYTASDVGAVATNSAITGATKTKITYDSKGLVTSGTDATTADIADSTNKRYVTDANLTVIGNTSGTNTGDQTFLNPRVQSVTSSATVTATSTNDIVTITAQAVGLTLANPTGAFAEGQSLILRIKDNGTARSIAYGANFRAIGVTAPTTTVANKTTYIGCIYNSTDTKFDIIGVCTEA